MVWMNHLAHRDFLSETSLVCVCAQSCPTICGPVDCIAHQASLCMGFSRQEYWSGLPCPPPGDLPYPGMEPVSPASLAFACRLITASTTWEALCSKHIFEIELFIFYFASCLYLTKAETAKRSGRHSWVPSFPRIPAKRQRKTTNHWWTWHLPLCLVAR